jgi:hypothetical protein
MNPESIKNSLDRYFAGTSSLEEEQSLRRYFTEGPVEDDLIRYQPIFQVLQEEEQIQLPADFEQSFIELLETQQAKTKIRQISSPLRTWVSRAAAIAILILGLAWIIQQPKQNTETAAIDWSKYEPENPEEALEYYKKAMLKLGAALNEGASTAAQNVKHVEEVGQFFN